MNKNNITKIFFLIALMILSTSIVLAELVPSNLIGGVAAHTPDVTIDPVLVRDTDTAIDFTVTVGNIEGDNIEEVKIIMPPEFSDLSCGNAPEGWIFDEEKSKSLYCWYITNDPDHRIGPGDEAKKFVVTATTASNDDIYRWEVRTFDNAEDREFTYSLTTTVDSTAPEITSFILTAVPDGEPTEDDNIAFSPNNDGVKDEVEIDVSSSELVKFDLYIYHPSDLENDIWHRFTRGFDNLEISRMWDGEEGTEDNDYILKAVLEDEAGNVAEETRIITIDTVAPTMDSAEAVTNTRIDVFFSEDLDEDTLNPIEFSLTDGGDVHTIIDVTELDGVVRLILGEDIVSEEDLEVTFTPIPSLADLAGNKVEVGEDGFVTVTVINEIPEYDLVIMLNEGWNLFSVPKMLEDNDLDVVLGELGQSEGAIFTYDGNDWIQPTEIVPLEAYWIEVPEESVIYLKHLVCTDGPNCVPASRDLEEGWQLIGYTEDEKELSPELALKSIQGRYSQLFGLEIDGWKLHIFGVEDDFVMKPTLGYWIFMTHPATLAAISL